MYEMHVLQNCSDISDIIDFSQHRSNNYVALTDQIIFSVQCQNAQ